MAADLVLSEGFLDRWRAAGLGGEVEETLNLHHDAAGRLREQEETERQALAKAGKDRQKSLARHAAVKAPVASPDAVIRKDFRQAHIELIRGTVRALKDLGDRPILAELRPAHDALMAEARPLAELCEGIRTDAEIMHPRITAEAREAWVRLGELWERREALVELMLTLVQDGVVPHLQRRYEERQYRTECFPERRVVYRDPRARVSYDPRAPQPSPSWRMAECVLDRHKVLPGLLTSDEMIDCRARAQEEVWERGEAQEAAAEAEAKSARLAREGRPSAGEAARRLEVLREQQACEQAGRDADFLARLRSREVPDARPVPEHLAHLRSGSGRAIA